MDNQIFTYLPIEIQLQIITKRLSSYRYENPIEYKPDFYFHYWEQIHLYSNQILTHNKFNVNFLSNYGTSHDELPTYINKRIIEELKRQNNGTQSINR